MKLKARRTRPRDLDSWSTAGVIIYTHGIMRQIQEIEKWDKENGY